MSNHHGQYAAESSPRSPKMIPEIMLSNCEERLEEGNTDTTLEEDLQNGPIIVRANANSHQNNEGGNNDRDQQRKAKATEPVTTVSLHESLQGGEKKRSFTALDLGGGDRPAKKTRRKRAKKPDDMPRRPLSAYNIFFQDQRSRLLTEKATSRDTVAPGESAVDTLARSCVKIGFEEMAKTVGDLWKNVAPEEKKRYEQLANLEKERYRKEMEVYKAKKATEPKTISIGGSVKEDEDGQDGASLGLNLPRDPIHLRLQEPPSLLHRISQEQFIGNPESQVTPEDTNDNQITMASIRKPESQVTAQDPNDNQMTLARLIRDQQALEQRILLRQIQIQQQQQMNMPSTHGGQGHSTTADGIDRQYLHLLSVQLASVHPSLAMQPEQIVQMGNFCMNVFPFPLPEHVAASSGAMLSPQVSLNLNWQQPVPAQDLSSKPQGINDYQQQQAIDDYSKWGDQKQAAESSVGQQYTQDNTALYPQITTLPSAQNTTSAQQQQQQLHQYASSHHQRTFPIVQPQQMSLGMDQESDMTIEYDNQETGNGGGAASPSWFFD